MNTTNNEEELKRIIARRENKMYEYYKSVFCDDFTGGYPIEYDKEILDFRSSVRRETVEAVRKSILEQFDIESVPNHKIYFNLEELLTNLDTISHEETH